MTYKHGVLRRENELEEVRKLVNNPVLGERKKGDLDFLRVHKFKLIN